MRNDIPIFETIQISVDDRLGQLRLDRPHTRNALNRRMIQDIIAAARWFNQQPDIKVVVISGNGPDFCSGFDLQNFSVDAPPEEIRNIVALGRELSEAVIRMRPITIASVHRHCVGGGVVLAGVCDFRYASEDASFWLPETAIGIPLAWAGIPLLVREIGPLMATELTLLCEKMPASKALALGMLNDVVPREKLDDRTARTVKTLLQHSHLVLEATKQQITAAREALVSSAYSFTDAHLLYAGLCDPESRSKRIKYLEKHH